MSHAQPVTAARSGWRARLELGMELRAGKTVLSRRAHVGPLLTQRPFYNEDGVCQVYVIHPPGGVVGGDELQIELDVAAGARALLTTPAAGKFYRSGGDTARLSQHLRLQDGELEWLPQENIFYPGCVVRLSTRVDMSAASTFIGWEMACFGLPARNATFDCGEALQRFEIWREGRPLLLEAVRTDRECLQPLWGLAGRPASGTLLACPADESALRQVRTIEQDGVILGSTLVDGVLVCRALAVRADLLKGTFMEVWKCIRPILLRRTAVPPRIWAT